MTAYTPTTSAAISNYIPCLLTAPVGVPRLDYEPITGKPLGLLMEETRTNLLTYSADHSNAAWTLTNIIITGNTIAPDGSNTMQLLADTSTSGLHSVSQSTSSIVSVYKYTYSVVASAAGRNYIKLSFASSGTTGAFFNLSSGIVGTVDSGYTATISAVGDNKYRCSISTVASTAAWIANCLLSPDGANLNYVGDNYSGVFLWGEQLELSSTYSNVTAYIPTSYIPTTATTVTRSADMASMTGNNFTSWFNSTQGTLYVECDLQISTEFDGGAFQRIILQSTIIASTNKGLYYTTQSGYVPGQSLYKVAGSYINGTSITSCFAGNTPVTVSAPTSVVLNRFVVRGSITNGTYQNEHIRKIIYYSEALSSSNLQALTS